MSKLVIVESPGKLKKIREILGKNFLVEASIGHIIEIDEYSTKKNNETDNNEIINYEHGINMTDFLPKYKRCVDKNSQILKLIGLCNKVGKSNVLLAADEDREGEMIAWSVAKELGINFSSNQRIVFNSITSKEINNAVNNPKKIDMNLLQAQQARAVLDKIAGFWISPILRNGCSGAVSAGRVQSVVVKIVSEKEKEINDFFNKDNPTYFYVNCDMKINEYNVLTKLVNAKKNLEIKDEDYDPLKEEESKNSKKTIKKNESKNLDNEDSTYSKIKDEKDTLKIIKEMKRADYNLKDVKEKTRKSNPPPPFTTSTMQQYLSTRMKMSGKRTMEIAQMLYEKGYITYMRTDSTCISEEASKKIKSYIENKYNKDYYTKRDYKSKKNNTQEAHECIRPTKIDLENIKGEASKKATNKQKEIDEQEKLYRIIWKRTVQSQMSSAEYNDIIFEIEMTKNEKKNKKEDKKYILSEYKLVGKIETLIFEGFLILDDKKAEKKMTTKEFKKSVLEWQEINGIENCKNPPTRYNEASLINKMDPSNLNIGRPSTYASIIQTIQKRKYVEIKSIEGKKIEKVRLTLNRKDMNEIKKNIVSTTLGKEVGKFVPTELGIKAANFLESNFMTLMDYKFTEGMEKKLDKVACGKMKRLDVIKEFYDYVIMSISKIKIDKNLNLDNYSNNSNSSNSNKDIIGIHEKENVLMFDSKYGRIIKHKDKIVNYKKLIEAHDLKLYDVDGKDEKKEKKRKKNNKKIFEAFISELKDPKIKKYVVPESLYEWKIKRTKYILRKGKNDSYYVVEIGQNDKQKSIFSLKYSINKISREKNIDIKDENIKMICDEIKDEDLINTKNFFEKK